LGGGGCGVKNQGGDTREKKRVGARKRKTDQFQFQGGGGVKVEERCKLEEVGKKPKKREKKKKIKKKAAGGKIKKVHPKGWLKVRGIRAQTCRVRSTPPRGAFGSKVL